MKGELVIAYPSSFLILLRRLSAFSMVKMIFGLSADMVSNARPGAGNPDAAPVFAGDDVAYEQLPARRRYGGKLRTIGERLAHDCRSVGCQSRADDARLALVVAFPDGYQAVFFIRHQRGIAAHLSAREKLALRKCLTAVARFGPIESCASALAGREPDDAQSAVAADAQARPGDGTTRYLPIIVADDLRRREAAARILR